ncbi:MAG: formylglycine-generating enzyme family protein [Fuerstiella sp.]
MATFSRRSPLLDPSFPICCLCVYRLPTEAEWEYACRAGTQTAYSFGDSESELGDHAWYDKNSGNATRGVGLLKPNGWGLYDMHGNVFEWCQDWYASGSVTDPTGASSGSIRVYRGGSFNGSSVHCRSAYRGGYAPVDRISFLGFRVLRSAKKDTTAMDEIVETDESPTVVALKEGTIVEDDFSGEALEPRWKCYADNGLIVEESDGVVKIHGMAPSSTGRYVNVGFELAHAITAGSFESQIDVLALSGTFGGGNHRQRHFGFHAIGSNDRRVGLQYWADQYRISHDYGRQYAPSNGDEMNEFHQWRIVYDAVGKTASVFVDDRQIGDTVMVDLGDSFTLKVGLSCNKNVHIGGHFDNFRLIGK